MRIQHNIPAMNAYRNYNNNTSALSKNLEKLSSGYKINRAGDDAAGLAISEKMRAQITGLNAAQKNVKDGTSLVKTAEGAMQEIHDMLNRMDYLATQSANGTYDNEVDRANLQKEVESLKSEINRIADSANFNGIKLLDGVSGMGRLSEVPVEYNTVSTTAGVTLGEVKDGGGSAGVYTITLDKMFSWGDTITVNGTSDGTTALGGTAITMSTADSTAAAPTFKGNTIEEQAKSIASALTTQFGSKFNVEASGNQIIMTANEIGTDKVGTISGVTVANVDCDAAFAEGQAGVTNGTAKSVNTLNFFGNEAAGANKGANLEKGDKVTLAFKGADGKLLTTSFTVTDAMADSDSKKATDALVEYLNSDECVFDDNDVKEDVAININGTDYARENTTGLDESKIKLSDLFTIAADTNNGQIKFTGKGSALTETIGFVVDKNGTKTSFTPTVGTAADTAVPSSAKAQTVTTTLTSNNFANGDKIKYAGTLANGYTFEVELEAGKDFEVDTNKTAATAMEKTLNNLSDALVQGKVDVKLKDANGNDAGTVKSSELFGDAKTSADEKKEFTISVAGKVLTMTSTRTGLAANKEASNLDNTKCSVTKLAAAKASLVKTPGDAKTAASSTFTLDDKLAYGSAIRVGGNTYEIVKSAGDVTNRKNTAIVVDDPSDSKAVAKAIAAAINDNESDYTARATDGTVTVSSKEIGNDQVALSLSTPYGDKVTTATFKFDPKAVKEGSKLEFNDYTYEFVKKGGSVTNEGAIAIELDDPAKASAKELGDAFANVIKAGSATVADDGTVTLKGVAAEDGKISNPKISWDNNLVLQIGDTADDFNQLSVKLSDMHTTAMGIDGINIGTQEGAQGAIDVIKDAINYVSSVRGDFGATQNRLEHTANNLSVMAENIQDAESNIRDTDVAAEMMSYVKNNILVQSAQAMLAQANQLPQGVLQLLG